MSKTIGKAMLFMYCFFYSYLYFLYVHVLFYLLLFKLDILRIGKSRGITEKKTGDKFTQVSVSFFIFTYFFKLMFLG